eukprot:g3634.t1
MSSDEDWPLWSKVWDPASQCYYYYQNYTGESSWEVPADYVEPGANEDYNSYGTSTAEYYETKKVPNAFIQLRATMKIQSTFRARKARKKVNAIRNEMREQFDAQREQDNKDATGQKKITQDSGLAAKLLEKSAIQAQVDKRKASLKAKMEINRWVECYDPDSGHYYYYNVDTHESVWDKPEEFVPGLEDDEINAVLKIQCMFRAKVARRKAEARRTADQLGDVLGKTLGNSVGATTVTEEMKNKWIESYDPDSGHYYYYNTITQESQWEKPIDFYGGGSCEDMTAALKLQSLFRGHKIRGEVEEKKKLLAMEVGKRNKWIKQYDPASGHYYYYNTETFVSQWEEPEDFFPGGSDAQCTAVLKIQCTWRAKVARRRAREKAGEDSAMADALTEKLFKKSSKWIEGYDPASGLNYYYNTETEESQWEKPHDFVAGGQDDTMNAASKIQSLFRGNKARKDVEDKMEKYKDQIAELEAKNKWIKAYDPGTGYYYYYNSETGNSQWEVPPDFIEGGVNEMMKAALKIQCNFRARQARRKVDAAKREKAKALGISVDDGTVAAEGKADSGNWMELFDSSSNAYYYYNTDTGDYQWEKPAGFKPGIQDLTISAVLKIQSLFRKRMARRAVEDRKKIIREQMKHMDKELAQWEELSKQFNTSKERIQFLDSQKRKWGCVNSDTVKASLDPLVNMVGELVILTDQCHTRINRYKGNGKAAPDIIEYEREIAKLETSWESTKSVFFTFVVRNLDDLADLLGKVMKKEIYLYAYPEFEDIIHLEPFKEEVRKVDNTLYAILDEDYISLIRDNSETAMQHLDSEIKLVDLQTQSETIRNGVENCESLCRRKQSQLQAAQQTFREGEELLAMREEERKQRQYEAEMRRRNLNKRQREAFLKTCRSKWRRGRALRFEEEEERKAASSAKLALKNESNRKKIEARKEANLARENEYINAFEAVVDGARTECIEKLMATDKARREFQEGRMYHIDLIDPVRGGSLLQLAVRHGYNDIVKFLLEKGANPNLIDNTISRMTPLHDAVLLGNVVILQTLLKAGARPYAQDGSGDTPLHLAARNKRKLMLKHLLRIESSTNTTDGSSSIGMTPLYLMIAAMNNKDRLVSDYLDFDPILYSRVRSLESEIPRRRLEEEQRKAMAWAAGAEKRKKNMKSLKKLGMRIGKNAAAGLMVSVLGVYILI